MRYDLNSALKGLDLSPILVDDQPLTLRNGIIAALLSDAIVDCGADKLERFRVAQKLFMAPLDQPYDFGDDYSLVWECAAQSGLKMAFVGSILDSLATPLEVAPVVETPVILAGDDLEPMHKHFAD